MNPATIQLILALIPLAEKLVFNIGGALVSLDTSEIKTKEDVIKLLEESKSQSWPELTFISGEKQ